MIHFTTDTVSLFKNNLSGSIPSTIGLLTLLGEYFLWYRLVGFHQSFRSVSSSLVPSLDSFDLSKNDLTNSIPVEIGRLTRLSKFLLGLCIQLLIGIVWQLTIIIINVSQDLLSLWKNKLVGRIPSEIGLLTALSEKLVVFASRLFQSHCVA